MATFAPLNTRNRQEDLDTVPAMAADSAENLLNVSVSAEGDHTTVVVNGEVDAASSDALRSAIFDVIEKGQPHVAVDMADVAFIDSSGLRVLIGSFKAAEAAGGKLRVTNPSDAVVRLLEITGQYERFVSA